MMLEVQFLQSISKLPAVNEFWTPKGVNRTGGVVTKHGKIIDMGTVDAPSMCQYFTVDISRQSVEELPQVKRVSSRRPRLSAPPSSLIPSRTPRVIKAP